MIEKEPSLVFYVVGNKRKKKNHGTTEGADERQDAVTIRLRTSWYDGITRCRQQFITTRGGHEAPPGTGHFDSKQLGLARQLSPFLII